MKRAYHYIILGFFFLISVYPVKAQLFSAVAAGLNQDLDNGTINFTGCSAGSYGDKPVISFNVGPSLSTLSSTFALAAVDLSFNLACGANFKDLDLWIVSPAGTCMQIYDHIANAYSYNVTRTGTFNVSMRDGSCLNIPNVYYIDPLGGPTTTDEFYNGWALNTNKTSTGNYGAFKANATLDMSTFFSGINPNGTWYIYAAENSAFAPCISAASITFANPIVADKSAKGESCEDPIVWSGQPICATNSGKTASTQSPGWNNTSFSTNIGGVGCNWNINNNNDTWVKFTSTGSGTICISVSGLDYGAQSIVVTDANADLNGSPCNQASAKNSTNDPNWTVVSCPVSQVYNTICRGPSCYTGTRSNQQHCFIASGANQTFYLVIDGVGGGETPFYITGISGPLPAILNNQESFGGNFLRDHNTNVDMKGASLQCNTGNKKVLQHIYIHDAMGRLQYQTKRWVSGYSEYNLNSAMHSGLNIIKVQLEDGANSTYTFRISKSIP